MICRVLIFANFLLAGVVAVGQETSALPDAPSTRQTQSKTSNLIPKSGVKLTNFMQICPTNEHLPRRFMQQSVKAMRPTSASEEIQAADSPANALGASQVPS
jgi:hypothetical protein